MPYGNNFHNCEVIATEFCTHKAQQRYVNILDFLSAFGTGACSFLFTINHPFRLLRTVRSHKSAVVRLLVPNNKNWVAYNVHYKIFQIVLCLTWTGLVHKTTFFGFRTIPSGCHTQWRIWDNGDAPLYPFVWSCCPYQTSK